MKSKNPKLKNTEVPKNRRKSAAGWTSLHAAEYGLQYYIAGRYGVMSQFRPTSGNQLHHAVELLLKAYLSKSDPWAAVLRYGYSPKTKKKKRGGYYGHDLRRLWRVFRIRNPDPALAVYDDVIRQLHKFDQMRYPTDLVTRGAMLSISRYETKPPKRHPKSRIAKDRYFFLALPQVDRLAKVLLDACGYNRHLLRWLAERPLAARYYRLDNASRIKVPRAAARRTTIFAGGQLGPP